MAIRASIALGVRGKAKLRVIQHHRLAEFERVFTAYLEGTTSAEHVTTRAKKMLEIGLPRLQ